MNLKSQCAAKDYKYLAPKLISNFTGAMSEDARAMELHSTDYQVDDGVENSWPLSGSASTLLT